MTIRIMLLLPAEMLGMEFNAVIEGVVNPSPGRIGNYKISRLDVPGAAPVLHDGDRRYSLYRSAGTGRLPATDDKSVEARTHALVFCDGVVLLPKKARLLEARSVF